MQRLPNGNTVVTSHQASGGEVKLLEVTPAKKLVWVYRDPKNHGIHHFQILDTNGKPTRGVPLPLKADSPEITREKRRFSSRHAQQSNFRTPKLGYRALAASLRISTGARCWAGGAGRASAVGHVFLQEPGQPLDDLGMLGLDVVPLGAIRGEVVKLDFGAGLRTSSRPGRGVAPTA